MTKARILANLISDNAELADGQISVAEVVGAAPLASPTFTGTVTVPNLTTTGNVTFGDNDKALFGADGDLEIYHDGGNSRIWDKGNGNLIISASNFQVNDGTNGEIFIRAIDDSSVELRHSNNIKLVTAADGVDITGEVKADKFTNDEALPDIRPSLLLDFANSKTLDPRINFTRGSTATYWDGKTTTKAEENLVTYSQDFSNSSWSTAGIALTPNQTAPDGTSTAWLIAESGGNDTHRIYSGKTITAGNTYAFSFYIKYAGRQYVQVNLSTRFGCRVIFDIQNGTVTDSSSADSATITSVGNSWYRCVVIDTATVSGDDSSPIGGNSSSTGNGEFYVGSGSNAFYLWGVQLEQRSSATAYTPTTSSPIVKYQPTLQTAASGEARFDHDPVTGESKGFLIEEARTNLGTYSSYISGSISEYISVRTTQSQNQIIAPDGTLTGDKLIATADSSTHRLDQVARSMFSVSTTYTVSCYAKAGEYEGITLSIIGSSNSNNGVYFNLTTGSSGVIGGSYTSTMEDVGNGWYRCSVTRTTPSSITSSDNKWLIGIVDSGSNISFTGDGFSGVYVWGVQVEQGAFPTSYIPTSGSTVTRSGELTSVSTSTVMSTHDGSIYVESTSGPAGWDTTGQYNLFQFGDSNADGLGVFKESGTKKFWYHARRANSSFTNVNGSLTWADNTTSKVVLGFNNSSQRFYVDGTLIGTEQTAALTQLDPTQVTELNIGTSGNAAYHQFNGYIKKVACWPKRLPNATLQAMTEA